MMGVKTTFKFIVATFLLLASLWISAEVFAVDYPSKPSAKDAFVVDNADIISETDEDFINSISLNLRNEKSIPIVVVTIDSLAKYDAEDLSIDAYSRALFDNWGIGRSQYNYGILLLVSKNDRKARIELGADWAGNANTHAKYVMDKLIIQRFTLDKYSEGIREGTMALDAMARGEALPSPYYPKWVVILIYILLAGLTCFFAALGISLIRSGKKGWGWAAIILALGLLIAIIRNLLTPSTGGYSNGGFSGGGSSGGGGASGSW